MRNVPKWEPARSVDTQQVRASSANERAQFGHANAAPTGGRRRRRELRSSWPSERPIAAGRPLASLCRSSSKLISTI